MTLGVHAKTQLVPKIVLWVSIWELHHKMVSPPEEGVLKEARDADNNIISINSTLRNMLPPQLKKISEQYKLMCGCDCFITAKIIHYYLLSCWDCHLKQLKDQIQNAQNWRSGEIVSSIFETYKNYVRPHGCHIHNTVADMAMAKMFPCISTHRGQPHWKCVLRCCDKLLSIFIPSQESNKDTTNICSTISFHVHKNV